MEIKLMYLKNHKEVTSNSKEELIKKGDKIVLPFFNNWNGKEFHTFAMPELHYMALYFKDRLTTTKGNWSTSRLDRLIKRNNLDGYSFAFRFNAFCIAYHNRKKGKGGKTMLNFSENILKKHKRLNRNYLKEGANLKDFLDAAKEIKREFLNCTDEEWLKILFDWGKIDTNYSDTTIRKYYYD